MSDSLRVDSVDEQSLLARLRGTDEVVANEALAEMMAQHERTVRAVVLHILNDHAAVDDVSQEVWFTCWTLRTTLDVHTTLRAYLRELARNTALNQRRTDQRAYQRDTTLATSEWIEHAGMVENDAEYRLAMEEVGPIIAAFIASMPPRQREVYQLSLEGYSHQEIGQMLKMAVQTVSNHMWKANQYVERRLLELKGARSYV